MNTSTVRQTTGCPHPGWKDHWERQYAAKTLTEISWYQSHPQHSLSLIGDTGLGTTASILDVGGGASTLVDHLLTTGYRDITVLDIARTSINRAQERLRESNRFWRYVGRWSCGFVRY